MFAFRIFLYFNPRTEPTIAYEIFPKRNLKY